MKLFVILTLLSPGLVSATEALSLKLSASPQVDFHEKNFFYHMRSQYQWMNHESFSISVISQRQISQLFDGHRQQNLSFPFAYSMGAMRTGLTLSLTHDSANFSRRMTMNWYAHHHLGPRFITNFNISTGKNQGQDWSKSAFINFGVIYKFSPQMDFKFGSFGDYSGLHGTHIVSHSFGAIYKF